MSSRIFSALVVAMLLAGPAYAKCHLGPFNDKQNIPTLPGCPADVKDLFERATGCQHWLGEEPYDTARAAEIDSAVTELKCDKLSGEYDTLLKKYAAKNDIVDTMELADREYSIEF